MWLFILVFFTIKHKQKGKVSSFSSSCNFLCLFLRFWYRIMFKKFSSLDKTKKTLDLVSRAEMFFVKYDDNTSWMGEDRIFYFPAAISFMRFNALPARNHEIWSSLKLWLSLICSFLPSACVISHVNGLPGANELRPRIEILSVGWIWNWDFDDKN